jgi:hypothetical protein
MILLRTLFALAVAATLPAAAVAQGRPAVDREKLQADLRALEKWFLHDSGQETQVPDTADLVRRLKQLRLGEELRREAIALAQRHARVEAPARQPGAIYVLEYRALYRLDFAWTVLLELEVLHPGMTVHEAAQFLGQPGPLSNGQVVWCFPPNVIYAMQPALIATVRDGRVVTLKQGQN